MEIREIACPKCGGPLREVEEEGIFTCPYCGARIRVTFGPRGADAAPDGRRIIRDASGAELARALLPPRWRASARMTSDGGGPVTPVRLRVEAVSPDGRASMTWQSATAFKQNIAGYRHVEGAVDPLDRTMMRGVLDPARAADEAMRAALGSAPFGVEATRDYPQLPPLDRSAKCRALFEENDPQIRAAVPPGMTGGVERTFCDGCARLYAYQDASDGRAIRHAVAPLVDGLEVFGGAPGMLLFGGALRYILWQIESLFAYRADADGFDAGWSGFVAFCSSLTAGPRFYEETRAVSARMFGAMAQNQSDAFAAQQRATRERQAAFDAYNRAWRARSDAAFEARRAAWTRAESAQDRISRLRSEATRGVNAYVRSDGRQVEYAVEADHVYETPGGETVGVAGTQEHPASWRELDKKS